MGSLVKTWKPSDCMVAWLPAGSPAMTMEASTRTASRSWALTVWALRTVCPTSDPGSMALDRTRTGYQSLRPGRASCQYEDVELGALAGVSHSESLLARVSPSK